LSSGAVSTTSSVTLAELQPDDLAVDQLHEAALRGRRRCSRTVADDLGAEQVLACSPRRP
jgi:hypothetical protein